MPPDDTVDLQLDSQAYMDTKVMTKGSSWRNGSCFINYRCKLFGGRTNAHFQLNVDNLFNSSVITVGQLNNYGAIRRIYSNQPRRLQFTTTFDW
jgi:outer membrane receptor for ferric coprogen and ferric-rhodotorulic acid